MIYIYTYILNSILFLVNFPILLYFPSLWDEWIPTELVKVESPEGLDQIHRSQYVEDFIFKDTHMEVSWNRGTPKSSIFGWIFHYKPSIWGYPYWWNPLAIKHGNSKSSKGLRSKILQYGGVSSKPCLTRGFLPTTKSLGRQETCLHLGQRRGTAGSKLCDMVAWGMRDQRLNL